MSFGCQLGPSVTGIGANQPSGVADASMSKNSICAGMPYPSERVPSVTVKAPPVVVPL